MKGFNSLMYFFGFLGCFQLAYSKEVGPNKSSVTNSGYVCFTGFEVQFLVGKTEESIDRPEYCRYSIGKAEFIKMISSRPSSQFYLPSHVRAKIYFSEQEIYFIDNNGVVRSGDRKFLADKEKFSSSLKIR